MSDDRNLRTRLKRALDRYYHRREYRMRPDKAKLDSMRRRRGLTKSGSAPKPNDLTKDDFDIDLRYDEATNDGTQDGDEATKEEGRNGDEEMAVDDTANDEAKDEAPALPDYEESDPRVSYNRVQGPRNTALECGSLLLIMPREILAQILKSVLKVDVPLSDHEFHFKCPTRACSQKPPNDQETPLLQYLQVREVLKTCKQIRNEGEQIFFKTNEWTLNRPKLRKGAGLNPKFLAEDTHKMFKQYIPCGHTLYEKCNRSRMPHVRYFRNFNMRIAISPTATVDLPLPDGVDPFDVAEVEYARMSEDQEVLRRHTLTEAEQCDMYGAALSGFVNNQGGMFQNLRQFTLEIALHSPVRRARSSRLNRCGTTFKIMILLDTSTKGDYATHPEPPTMFDDLDWEIKSLEPRRYMLAPLLKLKGVRSVEVQRRWSIRYKVPNKELEDRIADHALRQYARYDSISQFLEKAGTHFVNLLNTGLDHLKIPTKNLIEIVEDDDDEDVVYTLVPPAENEELSEIKEIQHEQR